MFRTFFLLFILVCHASNAQAKEAFHTFNLVLLQPDFVLQERVPDVAELSNYIKGIERSVSHAIQTKSEFPPVGGFIVVAIKPHEKSNIWLDFAPALKPQVATSIQLAAKSVQPPKIRNGAVVFAIKIGLWGGPEPKKTAPSPDEWKAAAKKAGRLLVQSV